MEFLCTLIAIWYNWIYSQFTKIFTVISCVITDMVIAPGKPIGCFTTNFTSWHTHSDLNVTILSLKTNISNYNKLRITHLIKSWFLHSCRTGKPFPHKSQNLCLDTISLSSQISTIKESIEIICILNIQFAFHLLNIYSFYLYA